MWVSSSAAYHTAKEREDRLIENSLRGRPSHSREDSLWQRDRIHTGGGSGRLEVHHGPLSPAASGATSSAMAMGIPVFNEDTGSPQRIITTATGDGELEVDQFSSALVAAADQCRGQPAWQARNRCLAAWLLYSFAAVQASRSIPIPISQNGILSPSRFYAAGRFVSSDTIPWGMGHG